MRIKKESTAESIKAREFLRVVVILTIITFIWYRNNHWSVVMGDDLIAINGFSSLGFWGNLFNSSDIAMGKIRPIQKIMLWIVYIICGTDYRKYYFITRLFIVFTASITYSLARSEDLDKIKAIILSILLVICPFSAYGAWQYIGISESFSLLCCMVYGFFTYRLFNDKDSVKYKRVIVLSTLWFSVLIFNAERFMYLVAVMVFLILIKVEIRWKQKLLYIALSASPIILRSILLKILGSVSLGTGRSSVWTLMNTLVPYAIKGYINMLGFSIGDSWHGGFTITQINSAILIISYIRVFIFMGILYSSLKLIFIEKKYHYTEIWLWYLFSLTSLFSYALVGETHGEDRFLWIPYCFYLIGILRYLTLVTKENVNLSKHIILAILSTTILVMLSNYYYLVSKTHVHFRYSQEMAQTAIESARNLEGIDEVQNIACVKTGDYPWVFYGNSFFRFYLKNDVNVFYYDSASQLLDDVSILGTNTIVIYPDSLYTIPYGAQAMWLNDFVKEIL